MSTYMLGRDQRGSRLLSLQEICTKTLTDHRAALGNIAGILFDLVKPILAHYNAEELARVEDLTWKYGNVDLTTDTWPFWQRLCRQKFGEPNMEQVPTLNLSEDIEMPEDAGDYRVYFFEKEAEVEEKRRRVAERARSLMEAGKKEKEKRKIQFTNDLGPKHKKGRFSFATTAGPARSKGNLLKNLGLVKRPVVRGRAPGQFVPPAASLMDRPTAQVSTSPGKGTPNRGRAPAASRRVLPKPAAGAKAQGPARRGANLQPSPRRPQGQLPGGKPSVGQTSTARAGMTRLQPWGTSQAGKRKERN
ncbi:hypothetical protein BSKO_03876 [Bryopsis sp. KO-2023]|nr:hypothetical protein BSKO_03876 [Bryopsis sp. KO-2023]